MSRSAVLPAWFSHHYVFTAISAMTLRSRGQGSRRRTDLRGHGWRWIACRAVYRRYGRCSASSASLTGWPFQCIGTRVANTLFSLAAVLGAGLGDHERVNGTLDDCSELRLLIQNTCRRTPSQPASQLVTFTSDSIRSDRQQSIIRHVLQPCNRVLFSKLMPAPRHVVYSIVKDTWDALTPCIHRKHVMCSLCLCCLRFVLINLQHCGQPWRWLVAAYRPC